MPREHIDLCGPWRFQPDPAGEGETAAYFQPEYDHRLWREALVPSTFDACCPGLEAYEGAAWYRRTLTVPQAWRGKRVTLRFEGVNYYAAVWVNGHQVGEHHDGFLPFCFPVHDRLRFGDRNVIVIRVDNVRREGEVPGMERGWRTYGGILREVTLEATDPLCLDAVTVVAEPATGGGKLALRAEARNERPQDEEVRLAVQVVDEQGETLATLSSAPLAIQAGGGGTLAVDGPIAGAVPWSPTAPNLYTARIQLVSGDQIVDEWDVRFGFRSIRIAGGQLVLNGEALYLTGFNRHEDAPDRDMATDLDTARRDLVAMVEAGANFVRLCHYPHHPGEVDLCDELGLLAMCEIPLYWWNGYAEGETHCRAKLGAAKRQLRALIRRDAHHPSVIFWSVSNETETTRPEVAAGNRELIRLAQELDATRLAVHVSNHWRRDPHFEADDVICVNAYPSLDRRAYGGQYEYDLADSTRFWREHLRALHERYPDKPILVTEFGYAAFQGVHGNAFGEDVQAEAIAHEFAGMQAPYVCGATIWCWADHPWPATTFEWCRYVGISPYGIVTRGRRKLQAYRTVRRLYRERQGVADPPQATAPRPGPAGYEVHMIRPHLERIPQIAFPEGYAIRPMRPDEGGLWADIERDAEDYFPITDRTFANEFSHDLHAVQWRCFIITDRRGVGVGTVSAWYNRDYRGQEVGLVHWIAIRPAYQGRGLGKAALSLCLNRLACWHDRALLGTQTRRIRAIKLYLNFGFVPDLDAPGMVEIWREVAQELKHPALERALAGVGELGN
jgi:beta-glucuronidase